MRQVYSPEINKGKYSNLDLNDCIEDEPYSKISDQIVNSIKRKADLNSPPQTPESNLNLVKNIDSLPENQIQHF